MATAVTTSWGWAGTEVVGRGPEVARLEAGLVAALAGRPGLVLLTGDPGIGKTRLAREITDRASEAGALCIWGRSWEAGGAPELWPWVQILRLLLGAPDGRGLLDDEPADRRERLARILPEIAGGVHADEPSSDAPDGEGERFRLFEVVSGLLARAARARPLVLVIDDLHAADPSSILLLRFVMREQRDTRVLVVGTFRAVEASRTPARAKLFDDLGREAETLRLAPLGEDDVARLVANILGEPPATALVRHVFRLSEGNPLLAGEAVRLLAAGSDEPALGRDEVPERLPSLVRERFDALSTECRDVLTVAAVIGREFDLADLRDASGLPPERLLDLLGEAERNGVIRSGQRAPGLYGFAHGLLREALYAAALPSQRAALHRRVGEALEARWGADPGPRLAELARHFGEAAAARGTDVAKAVTYARRAGDQARRLYAYAEAAGHFEHALRLLDARGEHGPERCELLLALGLAQTQAGDHRQARGTFLQAADLARRLDDVTRLARAAVGSAGRGDLHIRLDREVIDLLEEALDRLASAPASEANATLRARLLTKLTPVLYYTDARERGAAAAAEGLAIARRLGAPSLLAAALDAQHFALWSPGPTGPKLAIADELVECARAARLRESEAAGHCWRFVDLLEIGDLVGATEALDAYTQLAGELRQPLFLWRAAVYRAVLALLQGRFADAERLGQEALAAGERMASRTPMLIAGIHLYVLRREQGRLAEIEPMLRAMAEQNASMPAFRAALAHFCAEAGRRDEARTELEAVARAGFASFPRDANWLSMMGELTQVVAFLGDAPRAAELYELLAPFAEQIVVTGIGDLCEGSVARHLGTLAATLGRWDVATRHFERGLVRDEALGARPSVARGKYELARMLVARAGSGDAVAAAGLLDEAAALAATIGMAALAEAIAALRAAIAGGAGAGNEMRRAGRRWTVAFAGTTASIKHGKGLEYLALLLEHPGREWHALDLTAAVSGGGSAARPVGDREATDEHLAVRGLGDAGAVLDGRGKAEYRARRAALRAELADAESAADGPRTERVRAEIEALERALAEAYGLGGREVRAVSAAERARVAATKAIRQAIAAIRVAHPPLGTHLDGTIRTGRFFVYAGDATATWQVVRTDTSATSARGRRGGARPAVDPETPPAR